MNLSAVKNFHAAVTDVIKLNKMMADGVSDFDGMIQTLTQMIHQLQEANNDMNSAKARLAEKIREIERRIAELRERHTQLQNDLSELKEELAATPKNYTESNGEGGYITIRNPAYDALKDQIADIKAEITEVNAELHEEREQLNRVKDIDTQLKAHIRTVTAAIKELEGKKTLSRSLKAEMEAQKQACFVRSYSANEGLKKIENVIKDYSAIKMNYADTGMNLNQSNGNFIKNNVIIQKVNEKVHNIEYDSEGHIKSYSGRDYGDTLYNSYEDRLGNIPKTSSNLGYFEGERGESRFVPSELTAEGIAVIEILQEYGLKGIVYRNAEPDFEVCSEEIVQIDDMTGNRENYGDNPGNFTQADIKCAAKWNQENKDGHPWQAADVREYRKKNNLTWHEKCDTKTVVMVRTEINDYFKHSGGCSECKARDAKKNNQQIADFDEEN